ADPDVKAIGEALREGVGVGPLLEHLTGEAGRRGHSRVREALYQRRNAALVSAAAPWRGLSPPDPAQLLSSALERYAAAAWPRERHLADCPHPEGSVRAHLWTALRAFDRVPGRRQLQRILGG